MTKNNPLTSVIITNYNYGEYIDEAIKSVLNQTYKNIELIIINDGSTDNSDKIIKKYLKENPQIVYINQKNLGANITRNKGIELAKGEYIFLLDADNWLNPDHINKMHSTAMAKKADVVYTDSRHFGDDTNVHVMPEFDIDYLKITNFIDSASLVRKVAIGKNKFDAWLNRRFLQDYDFFLGLALKGCKIVKCGDTALNYRVHAKQNGSKQGNVDKLKKFIENYEYIINKYKKLYPKKFGVGVKLINNIIKDNMLFQIDNIMLSSQNTELQHQNTELQHQNTELQHQNTELQNSLSWKITKPLRTVNRLFHKILK